MPQTYGFSVSMPVTDTLPRNRFVNHFHMEHSIGSLADTNLESMCADIIGVWQHHYRDNARELQCKAYDTDAKPNYPRANVIVNAGVPWVMSVPRELALVLSYAAHNRGNKRERGRMYLAPGIASVGLMDANLRPTQAQLDWALAFYGESNNSLPDLGGIDWKFGVWSKVAQKFTQTQQAWVNDDWDIQRRRGLRETTRVTSTREG
jgi:hypothetical protein